MTIPHEYLDKDELLFEMTNAFIPQDMDTCRAHSLAKKLIANAPAADVVEVRHGKWDINRNCSVCGVYKFEGLDADVWADWDIDYCPHCGAKMDGGKK